MVLKTVVQTAGRGILYVKIQVFKNLKLKQYKGEFGDPIVGIFATCASP